MTKPASTSIGEMGYSYYTPDPGKVETHMCGICGKKCNVERNVKTVRGRAAAMFGSKSDCDRFECPNLGKNWHSKAADLPYEGKRQQSPTIAKIYQKDAADILSEKLGESISKRLVEKYISRDL